MFRYHKQQGLYFTYKTGYKLHLHQTKNFTLSLFIFVHFPFVDSYTMHIKTRFFTYLPEMWRFQQLIPQFLVSGPLVFNTNGSIRTQSKEKMEAKRIDHMTTMVGVRFCRPIRPLRNGQRWTITQNAKKSFPNRGPHDSYPLFMASEIPATTPTRLMIKIVVGGIRRVVHLKVYNSPKSSSSVALDVTVKLVSIPAKTFRRPWKTAKRCADTPPMTQNCSFLHHSSMVTPLHLSSRMPVIKIDMNRAMKQRLAKVLIWIMKQIEK